MTVPVRTTAMSDPVVSAYQIATSKLNGRLIAPYQREGVVWMLLRELSQSSVKGGFLCDEMGLGKTIQTITTILGNPKPNTLIIVPKSIINQWAEEIENFAPNLKVLVHDGPERTTNASVFLNYDIVITSYGVSFNKGSKDNNDTVLHKIKWDRLIIDEGHEIRNHQSKKYKSIMCIQSSIRWILTGTPVFNSMNDFVTLCKVLGIPPKQVQGFTQQVRTTFVLRRTKEDVAKYNIRLELPPCDFKNVELTMYPEEQEIYSTTYAQGGEVIENILKTGNISMGMMGILEAFLRCRQAMVHPQLLINGIAKKEDTEPEVWEGRSKKMETLLELVNTHPKEKSLIFSQFIEEMNLLHEAFYQQGIVVHRIDGSISKQERVNQIKKFKECTKQCVFLIQIKAGGQGLNLQEATRVYITSPSWNPATELQAIGRSHRTGQTKKVYVKKLIYISDGITPSIEESILSLQGHKSIVSAEVLNDTRLLKQLPILKTSSITFRELRKLFSTNVKND